MDQSVNFEYLCFSFPADGFVGERSLDEHEHAQHAEPFDVQRLRRLQTDAVSSDAAQEAQGALHTGTGQSLVLCFWKLIHPFENRGCARGARAMPAISHAPEIASGPGARALSLRSWAPQTRDVLLIHFLVSASSRAGDAARQCTPRFFLTDTENRF